jgi:putative phosphoesterase
MKLLIASDLHGSKYYTELLLRQFKKEQADLLLLLGDYLNHGPRNPITKDYNPVEVARLLNEVKQNVIAVRGNCDSEVDQMLLEFPIMGDHTQLMINHHYFFLTHGHIDSGLLPEIKQGAIYLAGHTHIPILAREAGNITLNPGSITLPKENHPHTYAMFSQGVLQIKNLDGEVYKELVL